MVQLSATRCDCIAILWVSLVSFATITLCVASQVFVVVSLSTQSRNVWIHPHIAPHVLNLSNWWRWVVSFMTQPLYPGVRVTQYLLEWWLVGSWADLDMVIMAKSQSLPLSGTEPQSSNPYLVTVLTELSQLPWKEVYEHIQCCYKLFVLFWEIKHKKKK
jgi:hypothetical protein